ncbi:NAD(P)/FAD-dependent oxidoreductase [Rhodovulum sulfidophilum]|uniref:NAD(P)/FAD-dependent oxidoreductase n=1 Tax=Rhodovulum sulfidophilum TaxID=35806 RepID=UPI0009518E1D|nr:FAD-dependent oxidoreductase [Rhodovulum sulfidophilum]OLS53519.1 cyclopropane-fatty-acyl-phospholipid synthase [Rhodovulum sulfidophilum]
MPIDSAGGRRRIAVIGGGISGMGAAHLLAETARVTLFEAEGRLGGHARTVLAGRHGDRPVDTGFIVFNRVNYPHMVRLFEKLGVPVAKSDMSFGASFDGGTFEYGLKNLRAVFAQPANALNPRFWGMLRDVTRFNARALDEARDPSVSLGDFLAALGTGDWFRDRYLLPLSGAIWSTPSQDILDFPAQALIRFFDNHALLSTSGQHQWYTVEGGSVEYVRRLEAALAAADVEIRKAAPVEAVRRGAEGAEIRARGGAWESFDEVVFATHSDDSLAMLADASPEESAALSAVRYQPNEAVLHADPSLMPKRRAVWSSWNYTEESGARADRIDLTYWMNSLQPIPEDDPLFVTLNSRRPVRDELIYDTATFRHPVYDRGALEAQQAVRRMNGTNRTWFCGAWMRNGFHEDGLASAVDVAEAIQRGGPEAVAA